MEYGFYGIYGYDDDNMNNTDIYIYKREMNISGWWLTYPSEKYESQLG
jgi:hypothetical protein